MILEQAKGTLPKICCLMCAMEYPLHFCSLFTSFADLIRNFKLIFLENGGYANYDKVAR
ncbi:hypothetical protein C427_4724 [Paraglaciecola psychrophila 170]|uniref:Uncharacterized protein n=1 Tax=Paraglaciecola psychrophila 170 TaxID=1129794 RepID=M4RVX4_9ALTE|nr:hypothetical protein C427_4724 [Paraglaciecola psychrophila 170]